MNDKILVNVMRESDNGLDHNFFTSVKPNVGDFILTSKANKYLEVKKVMINYQNELGGGGIVMFVFVDD